MNLTDKQIEKFWAKIDVKGEDECWEWLAKKDRDGYGRITFNGKKDGCHRIAWMLKNGDIPKGLLACHTCDNPSCCNPSHLWIGTIKDNMQDRTKKGRTCRGENSGRSCLTEQKVEDIREKYESKRYTQEKLSKEYAVTTTTISDIVRNKTWRNEMINEKDEKDEKDYMKELTDYAEKTGLKKAEIIRQALRMYFQAKNLE